MTLATESTLNRRRLLCGCAGFAALTLAGCSRGSDGDQASSQPVDPNPQTSCSLDGMLLSDFPGPKGQIHFAHEKEVQWFCDTIELVSTLLVPEQVRAVRAAYVQDMGKADWEQPKGQWIDARKAYYVFGSKRRGSMGPTAASFADQAAAKAFADQYGGQVYSYGDIKPEMVDLTGGALHDSKM